MANIAGWVSHPDNPDAGAFAFDDGTQSTWMLDPGGKVRAETDAIVSKIAGVPPDPMAGAVAGPGGGDSFSTLQGNSLAMPAPAEPAPAVPIPGIPAAPVLVDAAAMTPDQKEQIRKQNAAYNHDIGAAVSQDNAAKAREAAAPRPAAPGYEGPGMVMLPGTPGGVRETKQKTVQGLEEMDRETVDQANLDAIDARRTANEAEAAARTEQVNNEWARLTDDEKKSLATKAAEEEQEKRYTQLLEQNSKELLETTKRKIDPGQAFAGDAGFYAFMAGFGDSLQNFGAALAGRGPVANPGATMDRVIQRSVDLQTEQKAADYKNGLITADQLTAERERVRLKLTTVGKQMAENRLAKAKNEDERIALKAVDKKFEADQLDAIAKAAAATASQESKTVTETPYAGTPGRMVSVSDLELNNLGITPEQYKDAMTAKVDEKTTASQAMAALTALDADTNTLNAIAAEHGGELPSKGVIDFNRSEKIRTLGARMGFKGNMAAEQVNQIIQDRVMALARSYGGAITESDLESATKQTGQSTQAFMRFMDKSRNNLNQKLLLTIEPHARGRAQKLIDIARGGVRGAPGVQDGKLEAY